MPGWPLLELALFAALVVMAWRFERQPVTAAKPGFLSATTTGRVSAGTSAATTSTPTLNVAPSTLSGLVAVPAPAANSSGVSVGIAGTAFKLLQSLRNSPLGVPVCAVLGRLLDVIKANLEGTIADIDTEFLHDFRVSVRRSRAVQRECKGVFAPEELAAFRAAFKWLQQITGDSRDLDVYVLEFDSLRSIVPESMRGDLDPLLAVLRGRRLSARRRMVHDPVEDQERRDGAQGGDDRAHGNR